MKAIIKSVIIRSLALLLSVSVAFAQDRPAFKQKELDQILAPIALYPDSLLSQILMASTYPLEVVQAARWSRSHADLKGQDAVKAVEPMDWDPSVKSLVAFPQVLSMMDERIDWAQRLGEAFLAQQPQVMDTVQSLRKKAAAAGNLGSGDRMRVTQQGQDIIVEPANPQLVYVPYYDPTVVYGPWWWPAYPPVYWGPPPGYYVAPAFVPGFIWGSGIVISAGFFFGACDWHHRHVTVVNVHNHFVNRQTTIINRTNIAPISRPAVWQHDPGHRRDVPYRHAALRQQFSHSQASGVDARRDFKRHDSVTAAPRGDRERPVDFRGWHSDGRRDAIALQDGREAASNRVATQGNDRRADPRVATGRPDERRVVVGDPGTLGPQPDHPVVQGNGGRWDPRRDTAHPGARSVVASQPAAVAPVPRLDSRSAGAVASVNGNPRQPVVQDGGRREETRSGSDRGNINHRGTTISDVVPAFRPSISSGNPALRAGEGNHRGDGGARSQGGGTHQQQLRGKAARQP